MLGQLNSRLNIILKKNFNYILYYNLYYNFLSFIYIFFQFINNKKYYSLFQRKINLWCNLFNKKWKNTFLFKNIKKNRNYLNLKIISHYYLTGFNLNLNNNYTKFLYQSNFIKIFYNYFNIKNTKISNLQNNILYFYWYKILLNNSRINLLFKKINNQKIIKYYYIFDNLLIFYKLVYFLTRFKI